MKDVQKFVGLDTSNDTIAVAIADSVVESLDFTVPFKINQKIFGNS